MRFRVWLIVLLMTAACDQGRSTIPTTPVGRQLTWFLSAAPTPPIPDTALTSHVADPVLAKHLKAGLPGVKLTRITGVQPGAMQGVFSTDTGPLSFSLTVDDTGKIATLHWEPKP
ncbi:Cpe/LpqF family protein [Nonomuraea sp. NPDC050556]|uniref:Cpe/LpqF family protein n=1 Tax=Nonomuraea sp. NPDC050556 TaxID=3364369 RepID=UPI0037A17E9E